MGFKCSLVVVGVLSLAAAACADDVADDVAATSEDALTERPVFMKTNMRSGTAAGWFDTARNAVFSLERQGLDKPRWIEQRWDGQTWTTTADLTAVNADATPSLNTGGNARYATAWDANGQRLLILTRTALWSWSGGQFTKLPAATLPDLKNDFSVAFDPKRDRLVAFGTSMQGFLQSASWEWDGATFIEVAAGANTTRPSARSNPVMSWDPIRERIVLFGGSSSAGRRYVDTYEWNGSSWALRSSAAPLANCYASDSAWDVVRKRTAVYGPNCGVREWNGTGWSEVSMPPTWTGLDYVGQAAYDVARKRTVLWSSSGTVDLGFSSAPNQAPSLANITSREVIAGEIMTERLVAADPEGAQPIFEAASLPAGATVARDLFRWTPGFDQLGPHEVTFSASDGALTASRSVVYTVVEPVFAPWFARGSVQAKGSTELVLDQTDSRTNGSSSGLGGSAMTVTCKIGGDNPTALTMTCEGVGSYKRQDRPFEGYRAERVSFTATSRINGNGNFYASHVWEGGEGRVSGSLVAGAMRVNQIFYTTSRRFSNGWTGHTTLRTDPNVTVPLTTY